MDWRVSVFANDLDIPDSTSGVKINTFSAYRHSAAVESRTTSIVQR
jgi:hypothetical protein